MLNQTPFRHIKGEKKKDRWTGRKDALRVGSLQANQASTPFCEAPDSHFPGSAVETSPAARGGGGGHVCSVPNIPEGGRSWKKAGLWAQVLHRLEVSHGLTVQ